MKNRIWIGLAYFLLMGVVIFSGVPLLVRSLALIVGILAFYEILQLADIKQKDKLLIFAAVWLGLLLLAPLIIRAYWLILAFQVGLLLALVWYYLLRNLKFTQLIYCLFFIYFLLTALGTFVILGSFYPEILFTIFLVVVAFDTVSYLVGRQFNDRPANIFAVSPNKTLQGVIGGLLAALIVSFWLGSSWLFGLGIAFFALTGDLLISLLKREYVKKDMESYLGEHGGILDRMDSLLFVLFMLSLIYF